MEFLNITLIKLQLFVRSGISFVQSDIIEKIFVSSGITSLANGTVLANDTDDDVDNIFGDGVTESPIGSEGEISDVFSDVFGFAIQALFVISAFFVLIYLLWGAFDYITSGGESDKVESARKKMTAAVIGIILILVMLSVWFTVVTCMFGLLGDCGGGLSFDLPTLRPTPSP